MTTHGKQSFSVRGLKVALRLAQTQQQDLRRALGSYGCQELRDLDDFIGTAERSIRARSPK